MRPMADQGQPRGRRERRSRRRQQREQEEARRRRRYMLFGAPLAAALLVVIVLIVVDLVGNGDDEPAREFPEVQVAGEVHQNVESQAYFLGDPDAPVHLIEWSDFQ